MLLFLSLRGLDSKYKPNLYNFHLLVIVTNFFVYNTFTSSFCQEIWNTSNQKTFHEWLRNHMHTSAQVHNMLIRLWSFPSIRKEAQCHPWLISYFMYTLTNVTSSMSSNLVWQVLVYPDSSNRCSGLTIEKQVSTNSKSSFMGVHSLTLLSGPSLSRLQIPSTCVHGGLGSLLHLRLHRRTLARTASGQNSLPSSFQDCFPSNLWETVPCGLLYGRILIVCVEIHPCHISQRLTSDERTVICHLVTYHYYFGSFKFV